jgi:hypothetical protein
MASSCPPSGAGRYICEAIKWPNVGPSSSGSGQVVNHAIGAVANSTLHEIASAMASAADGLLKTLSTMWMNVNTPNLGAAADIQTYTRWITTVVAVVCILAAAGQMAIRRRGEPATVMFAGLARVVVTGAVATVLVQTAGSLADQFSSDLMTSTVAHIGSGGWSGIVSTALIASTVAPGDAMTLIIALLIIISSLIQLMLMILRVGLLVVLTGTLPLAAAASMSDWGQTWWRKHLGWLAAWLLYKPAAPPARKGSSTPDADGGPSGAGATTEGDPPSGSPSSSPTERRRHVPPSGTSSGSQPATGADGQGSGEESSNSQPSGSRASKAAIFGAGLAAGISANNASWRPREDPHPDERRTPDRTRRGPEKRADGGPSGARDQGDDDPPRENGG